jgi:hypothetical protein
MKQTAVEWMENEFQEICKDFGGLHKDFIERFYQAKAKERSQKAEEYLKGFKDGKEYQIKLDELTFKTEEELKPTLDKSDKGCACYGSNAIHKCYCK